MLRSIFWVVEEFTQDMSGYPHTTDDWCVFTAREDARIYLREMKMSYPDRNFRLVKFCRTYAKV